MEKKSAAAMNENHSNYIPSDLSFSILSKLPLKSLCRFGCVCKSWSCLLENSHFMTMYFNNFKGNTSFLINQALPIAPGEKLISQLYSVSSKRFESKVKLDLPSPYWGFFNTDFFNLEALECSVNGVICLKGGGGGGEGRGRWLQTITLWNPTTGKYKVIPPSQVESQWPHPYCVWNITGFSYDHVMNDYKIIRYDEFFDSYYEWDSPCISLSPLMEIYSLRSNSWRTLDLKIQIFPTNGSRVYIDGMSHWGGNYNGDCSLSCLVSFDWSNEVFFTTPMPSDVVGDVVFDTEMSQLAVLNGSIALIYNYAETTTFQIFILGELGVKESWTKLFIVGPLPSIHSLIGVGEKGVIFFRKEDGELVGFDLSLQIIVELGLKGREYECQIVPYKESLNRDLLSIGLVD